MPEFAPGEAKIARAPITVMPSGLSCSAELFLGPDEMTKVVTSGLVAFTSTGASQNVRLPVIMPSTEGSYHVYVDIYAEGILIAAYQAIEDVVISAVVGPPLGECIIWGFVHNGVTREALPDVQITIDGYVWYPTSSQGAYEIRDIACKQYHLVFSKEGYVTESYDVQARSKPYSTAPSFNVSLSPPVPATEPQLLYVGPAEIVEPRGGSANIDYEVTIPDIPILEELVLRFYLEGYQTETIGGIVRFAEGTTAGTYRGSVSISLKRFVWRVGYVDYPTGVYRLLSSCFLRHDNAVFKTYWQGVDTGVTITVV